MELNAETVKKGLECCTRGRKSKEDRPCLDCPYNECNIVGGTSERQVKGTCQGWLMKDALALVTSQEQRIGAQDMTISELRKLLEKANHDADRYAVKIKELTEENERLRENNIFLNATIGKNAQQALEVTLEEIEKAKADTVRKMQERLKMYFGTYVLGYKIPLTEALKAVNQIAKEMLEGTNEN